MVDQQTDFAVLWLNSKVIFVQSSTPQMAYILSQHTGSSARPHSMFPFLSSITALNVTTMHLWVRALLYRHQLRLLGELSMKYGLWSSHSTQHDCSVHSHLLLHSHIQMGAHQTYTHTRRAAVSRSPNAYGLQALA